MMRQTLFLNMFLCVGQYKCGKPFVPLYHTMKNRGITTYTLVTRYGISRSLLDRLKHNKPISTVTLNDLCNILNCRVEDVILFTKDDE